MAKIKSVTTKKNIPQKKEGIKKATNKTASKAPKKTAVTESSGTKKIAIKKKASKKTKSKSPRRKPETLMCFLTTACVDYFSLPDNGYELNTLRNYRDTYLCSSKGGKKIIEEYYKVSPKIVALINQDKQKNSIYEYIYTQVKIACSAIENHKLLFAKKTYTNMVKTLMNKYQLV